MYGMSEGYICLDDFHRAMEEGGGNVRLKLVSRADRCYCSVF